MKSICNFKTSVWLHWSGIGFCLLLHPFVNPFVLLLQLLTYLKQYVYSQVGNPSLYIIIYYLIILFGFRVCK